MTWSHRWVCSGDMGTVGDMEHGCLFHQGTVDETLTKPLYQLSSRALAARMCACTAVGTMLVFCWHLYLESAVRLQSGQHGNHPDPSYMKGFAWLCKVNLRLEGCDLSHCPGGSWLLCRARSAWFKFFFLLRPKEEWSRVIIIGAQWVCFQRSV